MNVTALAQRPGSGKPGEAAPALTFSVASTAAGEGDIEVNGLNRGEISTGSFNASVGSTIGKTNLGLEYSIYGVDLPDNNATIAIPERLRSVAANLTYTHVFNERWSGLAIANPGFYTANGGSWSARKGFGITLGAGGRYQHSKTWAYSIGVAYNSLARSSLRVLPIFGVEWHPAEKWTVAMGFPQTGVTYAVSDAIKLSWVVDGSGGSYYVEKDPLPALAGKPSIAGTKLEHYEVRTGFNFAYTINKSVSVGATVGTVLNRTFNYDDVGYKLTSKDKALYVSVNSSFSF